MWTYWVVHFDICSGNRIDVDRIELRIKKGMKLTENNSNGFSLLGEMFNHCSSLVI